MEQDERWNQFAASGRVTDYLRYRESVAEGKMKTGQSNENEGNRENGNDSNSNGNDIEGSSH